MELTTQSKASGLSGRIITSLLLTLGGFLSLLAGNYIAPGSSESLSHQILVYIIPMAYIISVHCFLKNHDRISHPFAGDPIPRGRIPKTLITGSIFMLLPLGLSVLENIIPYTGKKPVDGCLLILTQLILLSLLVGLFEEGLFRHLIFKVLWKEPSKPSLLLGFFLSSLLFGFLHFGNLTVAIQKPVAVTTQVIYAFFLGMLFAGLYLRYQSLLAITILHGFVDFITLYPQLYGKETPIAQTDITVLQGLLTAGLLLPSGLLGILLLYRYLKKYNLPTSKISPS